MLFQLSTTAGTAYMLLLRPAAVMHLGITRTQHVLGIVILVPGPVLMELVYLCQGLSISSASCALREHSANYDRGPPFFHVQ